MFANESNPFIKSKYSILALGNASIQGKVAGVCNASIGNTRVTNASIREIMSRVE